MRTLIIFSLRMLCFSARYHECCVVNVCLSFARYIYRCEPKLTQLTYVLHTLHIHEHETTNVTW